MLIVKYFQAAAKFATANEDVKLRRYVATWLLETLEEA